MKKVIISLIIIVLIILVGWILKDITTPTSSASEDDGDRFIVIENKSIYQIVYDRETKVQYAISRGDYNQGTFTLLVDADGKPLLYEGE
jgi:hypothetical protein